MDISNKITELRKQKNWSQYELSKQINVSREIIGRYERGEALPSIEIAKKMADAFEVSLDYLAGSIENQLSKSTLGKVEEIEKLPIEEKKMVYSFLDAFITKNKMQSILK
jgi:transcriptional regulator with XRE-family HTH domain